MQASTQEKEAQGYGIGAPYLDQLRMVLPYKFNTAKEPEHDYVVPRIAHFIWHGGQIPKYANQNIAAFRLLNPECRVILWKDCDQNNAPCETQDVSTLTFLNPEIVQAFKTSPGIYSDLLRYEIVFKYGGIYLDCDIETKSRFDALTKSFVCAELTEYFGVTNASFGFAARSSFLKYVLNCLRENVLTHQPQSVIELSGSVFFTSCVKQYRDSNIINVPQQILGAVCREIRDARPIFAVHHLTAEWQKKPDKLFTCYERLFNATTQRFAAAACP